MKKYFIVILCIFNILTINVFGEIFEENLQEIISGGKNDKVNKLLIEQELPVETTNPLELKDSYSRRIFHLIYDTLFVVGKDGNPEAKLLKRYEWMDKKTFYGELERGVLFHDGSELTAKDIQKSLREFLKDGEMTLFFKSIKDIVVLDRYSFIIELYYEDSFLEIALTNPLTSIFKEKDGVIYGTGEYYVEEFTSKRVKLKKFKKYKNPKFTYDEIEVVAELNVYQRLLNSFNNVEYITYDLYKEDVKNGKNSGVIDKSKDIVGSTVYDSVVMMFGGEKEYSLEQRKAIENAVTQDVEAVFPTEVTKARLSLISQETSVELIERGIIKNNLYNKNMEIMVLNTVHNMARARKVKKELEKVGVKVSLHPHNYKAFFQKLRTKEYDVAILNLTISEVYPAISLNKILVGELVDKELENSIEPFIKMMKQEQAKDQGYEILDKVLYLIYANRYYIPLEHKRTYKLGSKNIVKKMP